MTDHVRINGVSLPLSCDEDGYHWPTLPPPLCPQCGESLGDFNDDTTTRVHEVSPWHNDRRVGCAACTYETQVTA